MNTLSVLVCASVLAYATAFHANRAIINRAPATALCMSAVEKKQIVSYDGPDFYWKFRLNRLVGKKGADLPFSEKNYPDVNGFKDLYDSYYLDLTLQGKLDGFDWESEKDVSDSEWQKIFGEIAKWSEEIADKHRPSTETLPANDFDLLKQFYPQLDFRELDASFLPEEVGANFPYKSMREMMEAAGSGTFSVPGYSGSTTSLEATEARSELAALKERTMQKLDSVLDDVTKYAMSPFPDAEAKTHYKALRERLAGFPQDSAGWQKLRDNMEKEVDEMARLASKRVDPHHGHGGGGVSPADEFEAKYGRNLEELQERMNKYKADPVGFLENSIVERYGREGLDVWKKSQEFAEQFAVMSDADKASAEAAFTSFLKDA